MFYGSAVESGGCRLGNSEDGIYRERGEETEVGGAADSCLNFKEKLMIHLEGVHCNDTDRTT